MKARRFPDILLLTLSFLKRSTNLASKSVCAVGFEPNAQHTRHLQELERTYKKCGYFVHFFTETAVSDHSGTATFYAGSDNSRIDAAGGIMHPSISKQARLRATKTRKTSTQVMLVRLADFLRDTVAKRRIPEVDPERPPRVVMKMDIEGSEVEVVADLISSGSIRFVNVMMAEWHERYQLKPERLQLSKELKALTENHTAICSKTNILSQDSNGCDFENIEMDDETYASSEIPLPKC